MQKTDVLIIGASASGLMCAIEAAKRNRQVVILDHANKAGKKILMSGGGRCNFTNYDVSSENFLSKNRHFCKSALSRFNQWDFIAMVERYKIAYHERSHGQLFCDNSAKDILNMLLAECEQYQVKIRLNTQIVKIQKQSVHHFKIRTNQYDYHAQSLVIATGGLSIPKMGATPFGYQVAEQFSLNVLPTKAGLVPLTLQPEDKQQLSQLSGIAVHSTVECEKISFNENLLFTHRGLSGPVILQISSYWDAGQFITCNLLPGFELEKMILKAQKTESQQQVKTWLSNYLPKRLISVLLKEQLANKPVAKINHNDIKEMIQLLQNRKIKPNGTEGYRTAEVTLGGVDCDEISSKTMESRKVSNLYFVGEVLDVTGWLGGYNFQWAWSSGWSAGQYV